MPVLKTLSPSLDWRLLYWGIDVHDLDAEDIELLHDRLRLGRHRGDVFLPRHGTHILEVRYRFDPDMTTGILLLFKNAGVDVSRFDDLAAELEKQLD